MATTFDQAPSNHLPQPLPSWSNTGHSSTMASIELVSMALADHALHKRCSVFHSSNDAAFSIPPTSCLPKRAHLLNMRDLHRGARYCHSHLRGSCAKLEGGRATRKPPSCSIHQRLCALPPPLPRVLLPTSAGRYRSSSGSTVLTTSLERPGSWLAWPRQRITPRQTSRPCASNSPPKSAASRSTSPHRTHARNSRVIGPKLRSAPFPGGSTRVHFPRVVH